MADNTTLNAGTGGDVIASDDIGGVKYQRVKLSLGADGAAADAAVGGGTEATALRVTLASDSTGVVSVDDNGASLTVDNAALSVVGGGVEATALRVTIANDSTGVVSIDDGGGSITVDGTVAVSGTVTVGSHAVTNAGTFVVQENGASLTALQLIDDAVFTDDAAYTAATSKGLVMMGVATTDAVNAGDAGAIRMTVNRDACVVIKDSSGNTIDPQVDDAAFTAATSLVSVIGGFATTDSVDSGDAGAIGMTTDRAMFVNPRPATTGGATIFRSIDLDESEEEIKATAGQIYWITAFNTNASARYLKFYNATAANVTVGTTTPVLTYYLPATGGFTINIDGGIPFGTAITAAATTGVADNDTGAPGANEVIVNIGYK